MNEETINALDRFVQQVTRAIKIALPDAPIAVQAVEEAAKDLRDTLQ